MSNVFSFIQRPGNVAAWDRYADVENNPLRYTDPSGHCVEGAKDYDECMDWVTKIENEWENYNVITCLAGDSVDGCKGWTALEVKLLYKTLSGYLLKEYTQQSRISFVRIAVVDDDRGIVGKHTAYNDGTYRITIADDAWKSAPTATEFDIWGYSVKLRSNFQGIIAHELTHNAISEHPELLDNWIDNGGYVEENLFLGDLYQWDGIADPRAAAEEMMAMTVASAQYSNRGPVGTRLHIWSELEKLYLSMKVSEWIQ